MSPKVAVCQGQCDWMREQDNIGRIGEPDTSVSMDDPFDLEDRGSTQQATVTGLDVLERSAPGPGRVCCLRRAH